MTLVFHIKFGSSEDKDNDLCPLHQVWYVSSALILSFAATMGTVCDTTLPLGGGGLRPDPRYYWGEGLGRRPLNSAYIYTSRHVDLTLLMTRN